MVQVEGGSLGKHPSKYVDSSRFKGCLDGNSISGLFAGGKKPGRYAVALKGKVLKEKWNRNGK